MEAPPPPPTLRDQLAASWRAWIGSDLEPTGPSWLQWMWTLLVCAGIALVFTLLNLAFNIGRRPELWLDAGWWWRAYRANFVITLVISILIHLLFMVLIPWVTPRRIRRFSPAQRAVFFTAVPLSGLVVGWPLGVWLVSQAGLGWMRVNATAVAGSAVLGLVISFIIFLVFNAKAQQALAEKRAAEAQLRLLQGQIEPHFLFNTLANVVALIDYEPRQAKQTLTAFTDYLRASLGGLRRDAVPLADELALAEAYLRVQASRMEDRLHYTLQADDDTRGALMPPLLLQPLVENAVLHGLEPSLQGGTVQVTARQQGEHLLIEVRDDGCGLGASRRSGNGIALENLRERLRQRWGPRASLTLTAAEPGTRAELRLPLETS